MAGIPGFGAYGNHKSQAAAMPHSYDCGDIDVPWNVPKSIWKFRAPVTTTIKNPTLYCGQVNSPSGHAVVVEAWKNGVYGGIVELTTGPNRFEQNISLSPMDMIDLRICVKGQGDAVTTVQGFWVLFTT